MAGRALDKWYPDGRVPKDIPPKINKINTSADIRARQRTNWMIYSRGMYSGTENVDVWQDFTFNAYAVSDNAFLRVQPMERAGIQGRIFKFYGDSAELAFKQKFNNDSTREVLDTLALSQAIFDDSQDIIPMLNQIRDNIANHTNSKGTGVSNLMKAYKDAIEQGEKGDKELKLLKEGFESLSKDLQSIQDFGARTDAVAGEALLKQMREAGGNFELANSRLIPFDLAKSLTIEKTGYTSAANLIKTGKRLEEEVKKIDASTGKLPRLYSGKDLSLPKIKSTRNGSVYRSSPKKMNWDEVTRNLIGMTTNYFGTAFEVATAVTLQNALGELVEGVQLLGSTQGVKVEGPNGMMLTNKTSKTDVQATLKNGIKMNISNKHQKSSVKSATKVYDGSLFEIITTVLDNFEDRQTLYVGMMNDKFWSKNSSMNEFISSLLVDRAVGGLGDTRVDFMMYQDKIVPLADYLRHLDQSWMETTASSFVKLAKSFRGENTANIENVKGVGIKVQVI